MAHYKMYFRNKPKPSLRPADSVKILDPNDMSGLDEIMRDPANKGIRFVNPDHVESMELVSDEDVNRGRPQRQVYD